MNSRSGLAPLIVIAIVAALVIAGGVYFALQKREVAPSVPAEQENASSTAVDMSDWKTYTNEQYGFEFRYPSEYVSGNDPSFTGYQQFTDTSPLSKGRIASSFRVGVIETSKINFSDLGGVATKYDSVKNQCYSLSPGATEPVYQTKTVNGFSVCEFLSGDAGVKGMSFYIINPDKKTAVEMTSGSDQTSAIAPTESILSTFRFTR